MAENKDKKVLNVPNKRELTPNKFDTTEHKKVRLKRNVPNLRFKEFEGEWKRYKVSDLLEFYSTNSLSWDKLEYKSNNIMNLHYGLIHVGLPTMVDLSKDKLPTIIDDYVPRNYELCKEGDIVFADASEDTNEVAKAIEFYSLNGKNVVCGLHTIHGRDNNKTVIGFKGYAFASTSFHHQIRRIAQGTKVFSISTKNFSECYIGIPTKDEQRKIADFLRLIDERIATQNKIIDKLESLIKGLNQQLLYNNKWKTYKIKDIADIGRGRVISSIEIEKQHQPKYPVYSSQTSNNGIMGYLDDYMFNGEYITWTTDGANAGTVFYRNGKFNCTNVCGTLKINKEHDCYFVSLVLQQSTHYYVSTNLANPKLMNNTMASIKIKLPNIEEQNYLSKIFFLLNEHLYTNIRINKFYLEQKQYLLRQMFI